MGYILPSMSDTNSENATVGDNSSSSDKDDVVKMKISLIHYQILQY